MRAESRTGSNQGWSEPNMIRSQPIWRKATTASASLMAGGLSVPLMMKQQSKKTFAWAWASSAQAAKSPQGEMGHDDGQPGELGEEMGVTLRVAILAGVRGVIDGTGVKDDG